MRTITATEASRHFAALLDAIEAGDTITVTRGNRAIAEIRPAPRRTGRDLREALAGTEPPDDDFVSSIEGAVSSLTDEMADPWADD